MTHKCLSYNTSEPCTGEYPQCAKEILCPAGNNCYVVWNYSTPMTTRPLAAGCNPPFVDEHDKCEEKQCIGKRRGPRYYCCCTKELCNQRYEVIIPPPPQLQPHRLDEPDNNLETGITENSFSWSVIPIVLIVTLVCAFIYRYKRIRYNLKDRETHDLRLIQVVGSGRFGTVHKASLSTANNQSSEIAIKIISSTEHQSWLNEQQIYQALKKHENILNFFYSDEHFESDSYWLVVEYASKGSLHSYLVENTLNWEEFHKIALGIVRGLSHLHESDIAHRDFKSKNVLLKHDLTPCISDFGVATLLHTTTGAQRFHQVGTPRYMSPEVLEGSMSFTKASFCKIDVYALSLVLWELISRCRSLPQQEKISNSNQHPSSNLLETVETEPAPYKMPFEDEAGTNPDIYIMRKVVVVDKLRPKLREEWRNYPASDFCRAISEGWEYDHDARISASCFVERVESLPSSVKHIDPEQI